jgi:hypothetical protein
MVLENTPELVANPQISAFFIAGFRLHSGHTTSGVGDNVRYFSHIEKVEVARQVG